MSLPLQPPSAVDRLAALADPCGEAAARCRHYDKAQVRLEADRQVIFNICAAPARESFWIDVK